MLEALFFLGGGAIVLEIVALVVSADAATDAASAEIEKFARKSAERARAEADEEWGGVVEDVKRTTNRKWRSATEALVRATRAAHDKELDDLELETAKSVQKQTIQALAKAGALRTPPAK